VTTKRTPLLLEVTPWQRAHDMDYLICLVTSNIKTVNLTESAEANPKAPEEARDRVVEVAKANFKSTLKALRDELNGMDLE
jgi:hypothetical protein